MTDGSRGPLVLVQKDGRLAPSPGLLEQAGLKENDALTVLSLSSQVLFLKKENGGAQGWEGKVAFWGNISAFGIADLFSMLNMTQKTGHLIVCSHGETRSIFFRKGEIVFASSNLPQDRLGNVLYRVGKITKDQLEEAEKAVTPKTRFGALLLEKEFIAPKDLWWGVKYQLEEVIYAVFSHTAGDFIFIEGAEPQEDLVRFSLNTQNILMEGYRRLDEWKLIAEKIPVKNLVLSIGEKAPTMELSPTMQKVLSSVDGKADVSEIVRRSQLGEFNTYKILYQLLNAKILQVVGREEKSELREDEETAKLKYTIEKYSSLYRKLFAMTRENNPDFSVLVAFNSFFEELTDKLQKLFLGITLDDAGGINADALLRNVKGLKLMENEGISKIAGLNELFISQLLLEGLNELLNFEFFTIKNVLPADLADHIIKEIKELQQEQ